MIPAARISQAIKVHPRLIRALCFAAPGVFVAILYAPALSAWFQQDDFAWLYMSRWMPEGSSFSHRLFSPQAQGTIRPLGERLPFMLLMYFIGRNAAVFHLLALATQLLNVLLAGAIGARLLSSPLSGALVALLWSASASMVAPLVWASAYNQVLFAFFLLSAFLFRLLYEDSGRTRFLVLEWTAFLLGFGAQEWTVVYPALVIAWMVLSGSRNWRSVALQWCVAIGYAMSRLLLLPSIAGPYALSFGKGSFRVLWRYWSSALGPEEFVRRFGAKIPGGIPVSAYFWIALLTALALFCAVRCKSTKGVRVALFGLLWFVVSIGPVLLIPNQVQGYYLFVPSIGIAILGAAAVSAIFATPSGIFAKSIAVIALVVYSGTNLRTARGDRDWTVNRTLTVKQLYDDIAEIRRSQAAPCILLSGVDDDAFWAGYYGVRRYVPDLEGTYLAPGASQTITPALTIFGTPADYEMPEAEARANLASGYCTAYDVARNEKIAPPTSPMQH